MNTTTYAQTMRAIETQETLLHADRRIDAEGGRIATHPLVRERYLNLLYAKAREQWPAEKRRRTQEQQAGA